MEFKYFIEARRRYMKNTFLTNNLQDLESSSGNDYQKSFLSERERKEKSPVRENKTEIHLA